jgi:DNA-binding MurR/RpiR family transcriptional regulator
MIIYGFLLCSILIVGKYKITFIFHFYIFMINIFHNLYSQRKTKLPIAALVWCCHQRVKFKNAGLLVKRRNQGGNLMISNLAFRAVYSIILWPMSTFEKISKILVSGTKSEKKIANYLLSDFPFSAVGNLADISENVEISVPTIQRMVLRMGYSGFPEFRKSILTELSQEQAKSPLSRMSNSKNADGSKTYLQTIKNIEATFTNLKPELLDQASSLLANSSFGLWCIGGRFTGTMATLFARHLKTIRAHVFEFTYYEGAFADIYINADKNTLLFITDIRRYDAPIFELCKASKQKGAKIILITDTWGSPSKADADVVIPVQTNSPSGWDSNASLMVVLEEIMALTTKKIGAKGHDQLKNREEFGKLIGG